MDMDSKTVSDEVIQCECERVFVKNIKEYDQDIQNALLSNYPEKEILSIIETFSIHLDVRSEYWFNWQRYKDLVTIHEKAMFDSLIERYTKLAETYPACWALLGFHNRNLENDIWVGQMELASTKNFHECNYALWSHYSDKDGLFGLSALKFQSKNYIVDEDHCDVYNIASTIDELISVKEENAKLKAELDLQKITPRTPIGIVMGRDRFYERKTRSYSF